MSLDEMCEQEQPALDCQHPTSDTLLRAIDALITTILPRCMHEIASPSELLTSQLCSSVKLAPGSALQALVVQRMQQHLSKMAALVEVKQGMRTQIKQALRKLDDEVMKRESETRIDPTH